MRPVLKLSDNLINACILLSQANKQSSNLFIHSYSILREPFLCKFIANNKSHISK